MDKITAFLTRLFKWIRERYYGKDEYSETRAERRRYLRAIYKKYRVFKSHKYSGVRRYTSAPAITIW